MEIRTRASNSLWLVFLLFCCPRSTQSRASTSRIEEYLHKNCGLLSSFLGPACNYGVTDPNCCTMFGLIDTCRHTCHGDAIQGDREALTSLLADPSLCPGIANVGRDFCNFKETEACKALNCFMNLACFAHASTCDLILPIGQVLEELNPDDQQQSQRHVQSRSFALPELFACEATQLVPFDPNHVAQCPPVTLTASCPEETLKYRTIDGKCNNLMMPDWGRSFQPPKRLLPPVYDDGKDHPRTLSVTGKPLKSTRYISRYVSPEVPNPTQMSIMNMAFGQFIDHDFTGFPVIKENNTEIKCCINGLKSMMLVENGGPCFPISIDSDEDFFRGKNCMEFVRSSAAMDENENKLVPREQINGLTSFIDASTVYGSTSDFLDKWKLPDGKLHVEPNNMLPKNAAKNCKIVDETTDYCLSAGDSRVNVFLGLGVLHTVFHRHHNALIDGLREINPHWDSEKLFQEARKINGALHQHLTYSEYLPSILNDETLNKFRLRVGDYEYDPKVDPNMINVFSTAAFRFGHSQIEKFVRIGSDVIPMEDTLMRPHLILTRFDEAVKSLVDDRAEAVDRFFVEGITDKMFEKNKTQKDGLDLVALNTQRGRDHGLPSYNEYRKFCGLEPATTFDSPIFQTENRLKDVYDHVDDIDVFIGGVTETRAEGSLMGPLFSCIIGHQFHDLKFGDRFFYETSSTKEGFTKGQLAEIKKQTIASVLCANSGVDSIQERALFVPDEVTNPQVNCNQTPRLDLSWWKETP